MRMELVIVRVGGCFGRLVLALCGLLPLSLSMRLCLGGGHHVRHHLFLTTPTRDRRTRVCTWVPLLLNTAQVFQHVAMRTRVSMCAVWVSLSL